MNNALTGNVQRTNYAAHAIDSLREIVRTCPPDWRITLADIERLRNLIWRSEKFLLPENGGLLATDEYREHYFDLVRLPFPVVALEIPVTSSHVHQGDRISKSLLIAWTREAQCPWPSCCAGEDAINFTEMVYWNQEWRLRPGVCGFDPCAIDFRGGKSVAWEGADVFPEFYADCSREDVEEELAGMFSSGFNALVEFCMTVNCENVAQGQIPPSAALNQKRVSNGKTPFFSYRYPRIPTPHPDTPSLGGTHASPRLHLRRGHLRRLSSERVVWVRHALVGSEELGVVDKSYIVR